MMKLRIGTRSSKLALSQSTMVARYLEEVKADLQIELVEVKTMGDRKQGTPEAGRGDKKDWIYELELAILAGSVDLAVHSGKDVPGDVEKGTELLPVLKRNSPFDCFIGRRVEASGSRIRFKDIPKGAKIGTASLRRRAQLLRLRPDLNVIEHRGNVPTRIEKLDNSTDIMGIVIASAGLDRLGLTEVDNEVFSSLDLMPAVNQGTLACQYRSDRDDLKVLLSTIVDRMTFASWSAERACVNELKADCDSAVSIYAEVGGDRVSLSSRVLLPSGKHFLELTDTDTLENASVLGTRVGTELNKMGAQEILEESRRERARR